MKLNEIINFDLSSGELDEAAPAFKRVGGTIKRQYRCTTGKRKSKVVANPSTCFQRKDPKKVRNGKKVARQFKAVRVRKTAITKKTSQSKNLIKLNKNLKG